MKPVDLQPASYKSAHFLVSSSSIAGGRAVAKKRFIGTDRQQVEDLGLQLRTFTLACTIAPRRDGLGNEIQTYLEVREALLSALESDGTGILVHPFYGEIYNIKSTMYSLRESMTLLGDAQIDVTFEISNADGRPTPQDNVFASMEVKLDEVVAVVIADVAENFKVVPTSTGNFGKALAKVKAVAGKISKSIGNLAMDVIGAVDKITREISDFSADITSLVNTPQALADRMSNLFLTVGGLSTSAIGTFEAFAQMFDFGDSDLPTELNTVSRIEAQKNDVAMNSATQAMATGYAYLSTSEIEFSNTDEIDKIEAIVEAQYQKMSNAGTVSPGILEALTNLRVVSQAYFAEQRDLRARIVEVDTHPTSARLLAFSNYGSDELGSTIARLNGLNQSALVQGSVKILSP